MIGLMKSRHAVIMGGRPELGPGQFKERANRAGSTEFVLPEMVEGTLRRGFEIGDRLISPFARAVYMMFIASEVHPFADGNGRAARIMMNAELEAAGEVRLIIPTVFRLNYLSSLKAATHSGHYAALLASLAFARRWTARVDFTKRETAEGDLDTDERTPGRPRGRRRWRTSDASVDEQQSRSQPQNMTKNCAT